MYLCVFRVHVIAVRSSLLAALGGRYLVTFPTDPPLFLLFVRKLLQREDV